MTHHLLTAAGDTNELCSVVKDVSSVNVDQLKVLTGE